MSQKLSALLVATLLLIGLPTAANAVTYVYDIKNDFSGQDPAYPGGQPNEAFFYFTGPGNWLFANAENGAMELRIDDDGVNTPRIQIVGTAFGSFDDEADPAVNVGLFTELEGFYSFNYSFEAVRQADGYRTFGIVPNAGTITNPAGISLSFPLSQDGSGVSINIVQTSANSVRVDGWSYNQQTGGDFKFIGILNRTEVPEPTTAALMAAGLIGALGVRRRRQIG